MLCFSEEGDIAEERGANVHNVTAGVLLVDAHKLVFPTHATANLSINNKKCIFDWAVSSHREFLSVMHIILAIAAKYFYFVVK